MKVADEIFRISACEHRRIFRRYLPARRIRRDLIFGKKRNGFDAVGDHFHVLEFVQIFRYAVSGSRAVEKDNIPVFDQFYRRKGDFFFSKEF